MKKLRKTGCIEIVKTITGSPASIRSQGYGVSNVYNGQEEIAGFIVQNEGQPHDRWFIEKDLLASTYEFVTEGKAIAELDFQSAYNYMKRGHHMKLPEWGGYWYWDKEAETIMIHTRDGKELDIRETQDVDYTINFLFRKDWMFAEDFSKGEAGK